MKIKIRRESNEKTLREVEAKCFHKDETVDLTKYTTWWIAYLDGEPVGFATVEEFQDKIVFLSRAGVVEKARGMGIQKKLIAARERFARSRGKNWAITYTILNNVQSINSLISLGYKTYRPMQMWVGKDVLYWRKKLA